MSQLNASVSSQSNKLTVYSGHDTVIAPVLAALGVFNYNSFLCRWPSYASRIIFELYKIKQTDSGALLTSEGFYIRVLFNGIDVTAIIPTCKDDIKLHDGLCSFKQFQLQIESMISPYASFNEACNMS